MGTDADALRGPRRVSRCRGGALIARLAHPSSDHLLARMFAHRHRIVRAAVADARDAALSPVATSRLASRCRAPADGAADAHARRGDDDGCASDRSPFGPSRSSISIAMLGDWFEIARFPNRFQRQCVGDVRASYARRPDGRIDVVNRAAPTDGHLIEAQRRRANRR